MESNKVYFKSITEAILSNKESDWLKLLMTMIIANFCLLTNSFALELQSQIS